MSMRNTGADTISTGLRELMSVDEKIDDFFRRKQRLVGLEEGEIDAVRPANASYHVND